MGSQSAILRIALGSAGGFNKLRILTDCRETRGASP